MSIEGLTFTITGTLGVDRVKVHDLIREHGGIVRPNVTKKNDYLVVGEAPGARKVKKALAYGIRIISGYEFGKMFPEYRELSELEWASKIDPTAVDEI